MQTEIPASSPQNLDQMLRASNMTRSKLEEHKWFARMRPWDYLPQRFDMPHWNDNLTKMTRGAVQAIVENKPLVVGSAHAQGKDYLFGRLPLWFFQFFAPCMILMTAPTDRQVQHVMWKELSIAYKGRRGQDDNLGKLYKTKFVGFKLDENGKLIENEDHFILPFTTKETGEGIGKFQGFHSPHVMVVFSEAQAIDDKVYDQVDGVLTGALNLFVCLGNPTRSTGRFAAMLQNKRDNVVVNLNALECANYKAKKVVVPGMATYEWVEDKRRRWGTDDPRWYGKVLGEVPPSGVDQVIPPKYYKISQTLRLHKPELKCVIACDPSGGGVDECEILCIKNNEIIAHKTLSGVIISENPEKVAHEMVIMRKDHGASAYTWDKNGLGHFLGALVKKIDRDEFVEYFPFNSSEKDHAGEEFQNDRAWIHFHCRTKMISGQTPMPADDDGGWNDKLKEEALAPEYFTNTRGLIQIESKDDIRDKIGRSPNAFDAWLMGIWASGKARTTREYLQLVKSKQRPDGWDEPEETPSFMGR